MSIGPLSGAGVVNLSGTMTENVTGTTEFDGTLTGAGVFIQDGPGTLILTNSATNFNGTIRIGAGTLEVGNALALQGVTLDMNAADSGNLATGAGVTSITLGGLTGARNLASPVGLLTVGSDGASTTYSGNLSGVTTLTKVVQGRSRLAG